MASSKSALVSLYKQLLRESEKFSSYNFRAYAIRRVRDAYRENRSVTNPEIVAQNVKIAKENLELIKRQVIVGNLYSTDKLVIENKN